MVSTTGGRPGTLVGEWDGEHFVPLSALSDAGTYQDLAPRWAA
jgi:hypothetical protein